MSSPHYSPFTKRMHRKLRAAGFKRSRLKDATILQRAFVEALKEEVEWRFHIDSEGGIYRDNQYRPLVIAGLGSFKMKTRPQRTFYGGVANEISTGITKGPCRRLVFTAKWEEIK